MSECERNRTYGNYCGRCKLNPCKCHESLEDLSDSFDKAKIRSYVDNYTEDQITEMIDEEIPNFLDDNWEEEFDSEYEAYIEQGRGEAESQVKAYIISEIKEKAEIADNKDAEQYIEDYLTTRFENLIT